MEPELIAPCGMNCALCASRLALAAGVPRKAGRVSHCPGCRPRDKRCAFLKKRCARLRDGRVAFCFECSEMPCPDLLRVDSLYRRRYGMSLVANLQALEADGMASFLDRQREEHACPACGDIICIHDRRCYACGALAAPRAALAAPSKGPARAGKGKKS